MITRRVRDPMILLALVGELALTGCGWGSPSDSSGVPAGPPVLIFVSPAGGARGVSPVTPITLRWNAPIAAGMEHLVDLHEGGITAPSVPMGCLWSADRRTLTCTPSAPLRPAMLHTIHIGGGVRGQSGQLADMERYGMALGGQWVVGGFTTGAHAGSPWETTGGEWRASNGSFGMAFAFTTA